MQHQVFNERRKLTPMQAIRGVPEDEGRRLCDMYDGRDKIDPPFDPPFDAVQNWVHEQHLFEWKR
jgi:hypothetical protein